MSYAVTRSLKIMQEDAEGDVLINVSIEAMDYRGVSHKLKIRVAIPSDDICMLTSDTLDVPFARISSASPRVAERVYVVGAPAGIFTPDRPLIVDGFFTGNMRHGDQYTVPSALGSSGSPVFRSDGTLVGLLHSVHPDYEHASYGSDLSAIRSIITTDLRH